MSNDGEEMENEEESGEDQSEEASRSSKQSSRSRAQSDSADKRSKSQKKKALKQEKMRKVVSATIQARLMREAPENGPFQPRRESGGSSRSSRSRSAKSTPQFSKPNRSSEDVKSDENLSESQFSVAFENTSLVSKFSNPPLETVENGDGNEDEDIPGLSEEEEDENGPDFLERLERDIEFGCSSRIENSDGILRVRTSGDQEIAMAMERDQQKNVLTAFWTAKGYYLAGRSAGFRIATNES